MSTKQTYYICLTALMAAIIYVFTALFHVPSLTGYVHVGDGFLFLAASVLPAPYAALAGGLGAGLSDLLSGYAIWVPGTVLIKATTAFFFSGNRSTIINKRNIFGILPAGLLCVGGYYLYNALITGNFTAPLLEIPGNISQTVFSGALYLLLGFALDKAKAKQRLLQF